MVFGCSAYPAGSTASARVVMNSALLRPCICLRPLCTSLPSSLRVAPLRYFGHSPRCHTPPIGACRLVGADSTTLFSSLTLRSSWHLRCSLPLPVLHQLRFAPPFRTFRHRLHTPLRSPALLPHTIPIPFPSSGRSAVRTPVIAPLIYRCQCAWLDYARYFYTVLDFTLIHTLR